ncbi:nitroreductase family protein [Endozoicomonas lisbonensis]|uniref:Nitroreductase n=1 Tax=Endozoicomonas lisbonensis TaxID=3120522 RepID=A0ABV2SI85_9GAMM
MNKPLASSFEQIVNSRRAVRKYEQDTPFDHEAVRKAIELATLAPNSSNMQLWEFHRVISSEAREQVARCCMGQSAARMARELVVIVVRPDKWKKHAHINAGKIREAYKDQNDAKARRAHGYYEKLIPMLYNNDRFGVRGAVRKLLTFLRGLSRPTVREVSRSDVRVSIHKSAGLAAMTFMYAMKSRGYDTCPLEGFDSRRVKTCLGLPGGSEITMIIGCGKGTSDGVYSERFRVPLDEVMFEH